MTFGIVLYIFNVKKITIVTQLRQCGAGSVLGVMGAFEILNNHAPIVSALGKGQIRIVEDNADHSEQLFDVESGIVEVKSNKVNVLIEK